MNPVVTKKCVCNVQNDVFMMTYLCVLDIFTCAGNAAHAFPPEPGRAIFGFYNDNKITFY